MHVRRQSVRNTAATAAAVMALSALVACGGSTSSAGAACLDGKVKIGALLPLSGPAAGFGQGTHQAMQFAVAEANDAGGIDVGGETCDVELVDYDTKGTAEQASTGMNKLISQGTKIVWGPQLSQEVTSVQQIAQRNKVLFVHSSYAVNGLSPEMPLVFAMATTASSFAGPMADWVSTTYPDVSKVAIVIPDNQGGQDTAKIDKEAYSDAGIEAEVSAFPEGTADFAPFIGRLLRSGPGIIDVASTPPGDAAVIIKQLRQAGFDGPIGRIGGEATSAIIKAVGSAEGLGEFFYYAALDVNSEPIKTYFAQFEKKFDKEPLPVSAQVLPVARLLLRAIDEADSTDAEEVAEVLENMEIDDPTMGTAVWGGEDFYGIDHEFIVDFFAGRYRDGELTLTPLDATDG